MGELDEPSVMDSPVHERIGDSEAFEPLQPSSPAEEVHVTPKKRRKRRGFAWLLGIALMLRSSSSLIKSRRRKPSTGLRSNIRRLPCR